MAANPTVGRLGVRDALARFDLTYFPRYDGQFRVVGRNDRRKLRVVFTSGSDEVDVCGRTARLPATAELYHDELYVPFKTAEVVEQALVAGLEPVGYLLSV